MSGAGANFPQPVYAVPEQPRDLTDQDLKFISEYTGRSPDQLRHHILHVWQQAKQKTFIYMCVQEFGFLKTQIDQHPYYPKMLAAHKQEKRSMLHLDVGACFGQDTRRLLLNGWSAQEVIAVDIVPDYWQLGKALYMDEALAVPFVSSSAADSSLPAKVQSLGKHTGRVDFMWTGLVLHCMPQADCEALFRNSHSMLKPGGVLYGTTAGRHDGASEWDYTTDASRTGMLYSPAALEAVQKKIGFSEVSTHPLNWEDMTTGKRHVPEVDASAITVFYFTAVR